MLDETPAAKVGLIRDDIIRMSAIVSQQMGQALEAFVQNDLALAESVVEQDDQVDSLNLRVESSAFDAAGLPQLTPGDRRAAISGLKVAINLERIGDAATHIGKRVSIVRREGVSPYPYPLQSAKSLVINSIEEAVRAYLEEDLELAKRACALEPDLDALYVEGLQSIRERAREDPTSIDYSLHLLPVLKYLEKIGDYVLNIGEQAIFLVTGNRLHFSQYQQLDHLLHYVGEQEVYAPFHDGISGAVVAQVSAERPLLYKEGTKRKIQAEVAGTAAWNEIDSELVPQIISSVTYRDRQALLREFVDGVLLSQVFFNGSDRRTQREVAEKLCSTLGYLWERTLVPQTPQLQYIGQLRSRLPEVYALHPGLSDAASAPLRSGGKGVRPLEELLETAEEREHSLAPPFSVWLHGDLNANNIVFSRQDNVLKFIDVHRSVYGDYLQDLTVFMVGLRRVPDVSPRIRRRLAGVDKRIRGFALEFAAKHGDENVEERMLLGEARSYITSARIVLQPSLAEWLFKRGRMVLQELADRG